MESMEISYLRTSNARVHVFLGVTRLGIELNSFQCKEFVRSLRYEYFKDYLRINFVIHFKNFNKKCFIFYLLVIINVKFLGKYSHQWRGLY